MPNIFLHNINRSDNIDKHKEYATKIKKIGSIPVWFSVHQVVYSITVQLETYPQGLCLQQGTQYWSLRCVVFIHPQRIYWIHQQTVDDENIGFGISNTCKWCVILDSKHRPIEEIRRKHYLASSTDSYKMEMNSMLTHCLI